MRFLKSPVVKARILVGLVGLTLPLVYGVAAYSGLFARTWGDVIPLAVFTVVAVALFKKADRILDKDQS